MSESERSALRERRLSYPIRVFELDDQPGDDLSASTSAEERLAMVWEHTVGAWELAGRPFPDYPRNRAPLSYERRPAPSHQD